MQDKGKMGETFRQIWNHGNDDLLLVLGVVFKIVFEY